MSRIINTLKGWNYELKEHRLYCRSEIEQMGFYQRRFSEKYGTRTQNDEQNIQRTKIHNEQDDKAENVFDQSEVVSASANEKKTTISKFSEKLRQKMKRSKSRDTISSSNRFTSIQKNNRKLPKTGQIWQMRRKTDQNQSETNTRPKLDFKIPSIKFFLAPTLLIQISSHHQLHVRQNRKWRASPPAILPILISPEFWVPIPF